MLKFDMTATHMGTVEIHKLDYSLGADQVFQHICHLDSPVWLDSGYPAQHHSRFDILSACPSDKINASSQSPTAVKAFFERAQQQLDTLGKPASNASTPFQGGLIGYLGYDLHRQLMGLPGRNSSLIADAYFGLYLWAFVFDHHSQSTQLVFHPSCATAIKTQILNLAANLQAEPKTARHFSLENRFVATESKQRYRQKIAKIKDYIHAGDVYQVNYAQHFSAPYQGDCAQAYLSQRHKHPAPYSAYIGLGDIGLGDKAVLCHSPEQFIQIKGREVQTQPIKGTAPRADNRKLDQRNAEVLQASGKDRAENLMIVDLLRNDLGKSCQPGSISVPKLFELQSFSNVHHLVSEVRGRLTDNISCLEALQNCHPGGSITGAPKRRAMAVIDQLEDQNRSLYCGTIGFISCCGHTSTNIAIRTMIADGERLHCWGGGGIVADSDAEREFQETLFKVGPIMHSMEADFLCRNKQKGQQS